MTKKRGEQLIKAKVGIEIPEEKEEKNEEAPKKKRVRKVASE